MKYRYLDTYVFPQGVDANWTTYVDIKQKIWELADPNRYKSVFIKVIIDDVNQSPFYINLSQILNIPGAIKVTIDDIFLETYADNFFTAVTNVPIEKVKYIKYRDAERLNYQIRLDHCGIPDVPNDMPLSQLPSLLLTNIRKPTDVARIDKTCIVTINGFAHQTVTPESLGDDTDQGLYVKQGGKTANISGLVKVGFIDFSEAGEITKIPLEGLTFTGNDTLYGEVTISNIPQSLLDQQFILSIGGYLIFYDGKALRKVDNHTLILDTRLINIEKKIVEGSKYMDYSSLGLLGSVLEEEQTSFDLLRNSTVILALLKLSQSFLITIPKKNMMIYTTYFRMFHNEKSIRTNYEPSQLLVSKTGKVLNYWTVTEEDGYDNQLIDLQHVIKSNSKLYPYLIKLYPTLKPKNSDLSSSFTSLGVYNDSAYVS